MLKMSFIMPAHGISWRVIERAIDSLLDQDYKNWELIVVHNGEEDLFADGTSIIKGKVEKYLSDPRITYVYEKEGNVCKARNIGAAKATGDIYSFFSSDFVMKPGGLRIWMDWFKDNPDVKMLYSGYDWTDENQPPYPSQQYDEYVLMRGHNYIDGGMPIRKEVFVPWDENLKSLNDYEWVINIIKTHKITPMYIPINCYKADLPKAGGLSTDSHKNWKERIKYIREKHGIKQSPICCCSLGAPQHAIKMAKFLDADFHPFPMSKPNEYKMIYLFGFYVGTPESIQRHGAIFNGTDKTGAKRVIHWIGSDIQGMFGLSFGANRQLCEAFKRENFIHLTEFGYAAGELKEMGLEAKLVPLPIEVDKFEVTPRPEKPVVAIYHPDTGNIHYKEQYNIPLMYDIAESMPDVHFKFYGGSSEAQGAAENMEFVGRVPKMEDLVKDCTALLRVTIHDGLPISVIEFLCGGREVITSVPDLPGTWFCGNGRIDESNYCVRKEEIIKMIREVLKSPVDKDEQAKNIEYWKKRSDPKEYKKTIEGLLDA